MGEEGAKSAEGGPKEGSDHFRRIREEALVARSRWLGRLHQEAHAESVGRRVDQVVRKAERECDRGFGRVVRAASFRGLFLAFGEETACSWRCPVATLPHSFALEQFTGTGVNDLLRCVQLTFYRHRHVFTLATSFLSFLSSISCKASSGFRKLRETVEDLFSKG